MKILGECVSFIATCFLVCFWPVMFSLQAVTLLMTAEVISIIIRSDGLSLCRCRISNCLTVYPEHANRLSLAACTESQPFLRNVFFECRKWSWGYVSRWAVMNRLGCTTWRAGFGSQQRHKFPPQPLDRLWGQRRLLSRGYRVSFQRVKVAGA